MGCSRGKPRTQESLQSQGGQGRQGPRGKGDMELRLSGGGHVGAGLVKRGQLRLGEPSERIQHSPGVHVLCWEGGRKLQPREARLAVHPCSGICPRWGHIFLVCLLGREPLACSSWYNMLTGQTSLAVQWIRLCLPVQGLWVRALVRKLGSHRQWSQKKPQETEAIL